MRRFRDYIRKKIRALSGYDEIAATLQRESAARKVFEEIFRRESMTQYEVIAALQKDVVTLNHMMSTTEVGENVRECIALEKRIIGSQILNRWKTVDAMDRLLFPDDFAVTCRICGHSAAKSTYKTKISQCKFNGGKLERFVCPQCGCIFGPLKMQVLTPQELEEEYRLCYSTCTWNVSAHEIMTAESAVTDKNKVYLNYGSGSDLESGSVGILRKRGYNVYAYEPYANLGKAPDWVITSKRRLQSMKFDAIYSNDLLEHLPDPIGEMKFMKSLLKDENSFMEHSTSCFEYRQEFTRFHLFFFTGESLKYICRECGLEAELVANEERVRGHQYISYRFSTAGR